MCVPPPQVAGLPTNIPFLLRLATHPDFAAATRSELTTAFIARHRDTLLAPQPVPDEVGGCVTEHKKGSTVRRIKLAMLCDARGVCGTGLTVKAQRIGPIPAERPVGRGRGLGHLHVGTSKHSQTPSQSCPLRCVMSCRAHHHTPNTQVAALAAVARHLLAVRQQAEAEAAQGLSARLGPWGNAGGAGGAGDSWRLWHNHRRAYSLRHAEGGAGGAEAAGAELHLALTVLGGGDFMVGGLSRALKNLLWLPEIAVKDGQRA